LENKSEYKLLEIVKVLHFPLWIIKDGSWFFDLPWLSFSTAISTIILGIFILFKTKGVERIEWSLINLWLISNTLWMLSEKIYPFLEDTSKFSWCLSFIMIPIYMIYLKKNKNNVCTKSSTSDC
jgi:hypothetical protein